MMKTNDRRDTNKKMHFILLNSNGMALIDCAAILMHLLNTKCVISNNAACEI